MRFRSLTSEDIFISYSHLDGGTYASGLADELTKCGFSCFVDRLGTEPSRGLPASLRRKIRGCAMLVIIGTESAGTRQAIEDEIREFLNSGRRSSIVPVDFQGASYSARWYGLIEGVALESEKRLTALEDGNPSLSVVGRIEKQFSYMRRNQRLRRTTVAMLCLVTLLVGVAIAATVFAGQRFALAKQANEQAAQARSDEQVARRNEAIARTSEAAAKEAAAKSDLEVKQKTIAANLAAQEAKQATEATARAKAATEHQQAISDSLRLADESRRTLARSYYSITSSVSLAVQALSRFPTREADTALRESLSLVPHRRRIEHYAGDILDAEPSSDGLHFGTLSWDNTIRIYQLGDPKPIKEFTCRNRKFGNFDFRNRLLALSNNAAFAAVVSGNDAIVVDLNAGQSHSIRLVEDGFSPGQIAMSPDGKYIAVVYGRSTPFFSSARVLDSTTGRLIKNFGDDLEIDANMISFGPNGDLALVGRLLASKEITNGPRVLDAWRVIVWPLSIKLRGRELRAEDFGRGIEKRIPVPPGADPLRPSEAIAVGPSNSLLGWGDVVYEMSGKGEYSPIAYLPYTNFHSRAGRSSERRYAFNTQGQMIVITAKGFPSSSDWMRSWFKEPDDTSKVLARTSRSSWSVEWWDLGDYSTRVSQSKPIMNLKFDSEGQSLRVIQHRPMAVQCFKSGNRQKMNLVAEEIQASKPLAVSSNLKFLVSIDNRTGSVVKACEPEGVPVSFEHDLTDLKIASITSDGQFLALVGASGKAGKETAIDVYHLESNRYQRRKRLILSQRPLNLSLSSNGWYLIFDTDRGSKLWDVRNEREILISGLEHGGIESMWFSPDAQRLVVFDLDGPHSASTRVLRLGALTQPLKVFRYRWDAGWWPPYITFSPSGRVFLDVGSGGFTRLVETATGRVVHQFDSIVFAYHAAFSADESYLAIATQDQEVLVYRTNSLTDGPSARLKPNGLVGGLAISPDNRYVATGNSVNRSYSTVVRTYVLRMWPLQPEDLIKVATERVSVFPSSQ